MHLEDVYTTHIHFVTLVMERDVTVTACHRHPSQVSEIYFTVFYSYPVSGTWG